MSLCSFFFEIGSWAGVCRLFSSPSSLRDSAEEATKYTLAESAEIEIRSAKKSFNGENYRAPACAAWEVCGGPLRTQFLPACFAAYNPASAAFTSSSRV